MQTFVVRTDAIRRHRPFAARAAIRLGRLGIERCDGRPSGPLSARDVVTVFKPAGGPGAEPPRVQRLRPSAQLKLDLQ